MKDEDILPLFILHPSAFILFFSGRRGSRTLKARRSTVFETVAVACRLALPASCGGRNRTCNRLLNREPPYHFGPHRNKVRTVGFEPTLSGSRNRRIPRLSYVLKQSTQRESNPHVLPGQQAGCRYLTGASTPMGPEGLEPSPSWLRARHAAANTLVPLIRRTESQGQRTKRIRKIPGPFVLDLLVPLSLALCPLSFVLPTGAGGTRTPTLPLKRRIRCRYATAPVAGGLTFQSRQPAHDFSLSLSSPGRNCTCHRRHIRSPCCCYTTGPQSSP